MERQDASGYVWESAELNSSHGYLLPALKDILAREALPQGRKRLFELGCGNGSVANELMRLGWEVTGVDPSEQGIAQANAKFPAIPLRLGSAYDDLAAQYGTFRVLLSLEVVEHVYAPRRYAATLFSLLEPGGGSSRFHALSRLLEEPGAGRQREDGRALHRPVGPWAHQVLVREDTEGAAGGGGLPRHPVQAGGARSGVGQVDDRGGAQAAMKVHEACRPT
jgi:2-polyprenyl-6-hydroxyphenyl methylase/3-demethylubiquinone-9 3-methyltransferase